MKTIILAALCFLVSFIPSNAQEKDDINLGLISHLVEVKYTAETAMYNLMQSELYQPFDDEKYLKKLKLLYPSQYSNLEKNEQELRAHLTEARDKYYAYKSAVDEAYNMVRMLSDKFIYQLQADMTRKNSKSKYKLIDDYYKGDGKLDDKVKAYGELLKKLDQAVDQLVAVISPPTLALKGFTDIPIDHATGIATGAWSIFKDIRANTKEKVGSLKELLAACKLSAASEIAAPQSEEEKA